MQGYSENANTIISRAAPNLILASESTCIYIATCMHVYVYVASYAYTECDKNSKYMRV